MKSMLGIQSTLCHRDHCVDADDPSGNPEMQPPETPHDMALAKNLTETAMDPCSR